MRKSFCLVIVFLLIAVVANGQYRVGGGVRFSTTGGKTETGSITTDLPTRTSFNLNPQAGYMVSDKLLVGLGLSLGFRSENSNGDPEVKEKTTNFGFAPYASYYFLRLNKFSLYAKGQAGLSIELSKTETGSTTETNPKTTTIGINVFPGMAYDINDKVQLFTTLDLFNLGIGTSIEKGDNYKDVVTTAGFNANMNSILNVGGITLGAYFKF